MRKLSGMRKSSDGRENDNPQVLPPAGRCRDLGGTGGLVDRPSTRSLSERVVLAERSEHLKGDDRSSGQCR